MAARETRSGRLPRRGRKVTPEVTPPEEWLPRTGDTSLGRHDHHDDPEGNGPHAEAARSGCADRGRVLERRGRRAAWHLAAHGEGAFGHIALEAGCEQAPTDSGRVQGPDRRGPAFGKPRCAPSATGGLTAKGARCSSPAPAGAPLSSMNDAAVFSSVNDMAGLPKPRLRRRRILERPRLITGARPIARAGAHARCRRGLRKDDARRAMGGTDATGGVGARQALVGGRRRAGAASRCGRRRRSCPAVITGSANG